MPCSLARACVLIGLVALTLSLPAVAGRATLAGGAAPASPAVTKLPIADGRPTALGVYQTGNKFVVADSGSALLRIFDGASLQQIAALPAGRNVYDGALVVDEIYGRAYAASRDGDQGDGQGTGAIYVVDLAKNSLAATLPPRVNYGNGLTLGHDPVRHRVYVADYGSMSWINVATNVVTAISPPPDAGELYFYATEMAVNTTTNEVFLVQAGMYALHRLWILDADHWTWSSVDFTTLGAYYPSHVAVSEGNNKVFIKLVGIPGQAKPGLFVLDRKSGTHAFIGNDDYGMLVVNEATGRLFTGIEVGQHVAIVETGSNTLFDVALPELYGAAVAAGVRPSTDHAFIADQNYVVIVDGASHTPLLLPVTEDEQPGGLLAQDVAVNDATGRAFVIPDNHYPFVVVDLSRRVCKWVRAE